MNKVLKMLPFIIMLLGAINNTFAQTQVANKAWFIGGGKSKALVIDGVKYKQISPSLYTNGIDTLEKLQAPRPLANPVARPGYTFVIRLKEGLSFIKSECTSWQWVDIYKPKKLVKKDAPEKEIDCEVEITKSIIDTFYVDTSKIFYVLPLDTSFLTFKGAFGVAKKSPWEGVVNVSAQFSNGKKIQIDSITIIGRENNFRFETGLEGGFFRSIKQFNLDCDTCYGWGPQQKAFQAWLDVFFKTKFGPKREHRKNDLNVFVFLEGRFRMFGTVSEIPVTKTISRASISLGGELEYGPFNLQAAVIETLGIGLHGGFSLVWRFFHHDASGFWSGLKK